jgi:hypothetical protein
MIKKIEIERFSLTTSKSFDEVVACVNAVIRIWPNLRDQLTKPVHFNDSVKRMAACAS